MALKYSHTAGRAYAEKDGVVFFDTDSYPVQFFPTAEAITLTSYTVTFPDLMKGNAYAFARGLEGASLKCACSSYVTIGAQEWGPSDMTPAPTSGHSLSTSVVGTVPGDTDILLCRAKLTRTTSPSQINGNDIPVFFKEGEWVPFSGQNLVVERFGTVFARLFSLRLATTLNMDGTKNVIAERRMSVRRNLYSYWNPDNDETKSGWTYGGTAGAYGHIVNAIEAKGPTTDPSGLGTLYRRDSGSACSTVDNTDYESVFTGDIEIIPGRTGINALDITGRRSLTFMDRGGPADAAGGGATVFTYTSRRLGPAHATRRIWVAACGYRGGGGSDTYAVDEVTIGGVAATLAIERNSAAANNKQSVAWYYLDAPTGETGTVEVTYNGGMTNAGIHVFAAYNMDNTIIHTVSTGVDVTANLNTTAGGFALAAAVAGSSVAGFSGIENVERQALIPSTSGSPFFRGHQSTDGTSLAMTVSPDGLSTNETILALSIY